MLTKFSTFKILITFTLWKWYDINLLVLLITSHSTETFHCWNTNLLQRSEDLALH